MTTNTRERAPSAAYGQAKHTNVRPSSYEVFWRRAPIFLFPNCLSVLFCSFYGWPWLGLALAACPVLVLLTVLAAECLAFDRRVDTSPDEVHPCIDVKEQP
jgi:hypothetical protein